MLMHMDVITDYNEYIYFNDLLFFFYKTFLRSKIERMTSKPRESEEETLANYEEALKIVEKEEKITLKKCEKIKRK